MLDLTFCPVDQILTARKQLRRSLSAGAGLLDLRIAVLGGSTTQEFVNLLEVLLFANGFRPELRQSDYGQYYEAAVYGYPELIEFKPDLVYVHVSNRDLQSTPPLDAAEAAMAACIEAELGRYRRIWDALEDKVGCQIIQCNFEAPGLAMLGNLDAVACGGLSRFIMEMNVAFAREASSRSKLILQDVHGISARLGLERWFDWNRYFSYKLLLTAEANLALARSLAAIVKAIYGRARKALVLDLDNTLWGGVIGDDGLDRIQIGPETPVGQAHAAFQEYCLALQRRGILLAVCSKNDEDAAKSGFAHPRSVLKLEHFASFKANWRPKHENLAAIAAELNLGLDSFVFVDDNPAERAIIAAQLPGVAVPDVGPEVSRFAGIIDRGRYFEPVALLREDLRRTAQYAENTLRAAAQAQFASYGEYLDSLEMVAEIRPFADRDLERIAQLTNKTNQFNLTTWRYTLAEMQAVAHDPGQLTLCGALSDRFGDHGLVAVVIGRQSAAALHLDLWLMSCRVFKREMELAMLDALAERAKARGTQQIYGYYIPSAKNGMVAGFYESLGFSPSRDAAVSHSAGATAWVLDLAEYQPRSRHIKQRSEPS